MIKALKISIFVAGTILLASCLKSKQEPIEPTITFKEFIKFNKDSASVTIGFKDGDGDIGLAASDTSGVFSPKGSYYNNFLMIYYFKDTDGKFKRYKDPNPLVIDSLFTGQRIPYLLSNKEQKKALEGNINVILNAGFYPKQNIPPYGPLHSIIKYEIFIYDRALHKSNKVYTPEITLP